MSDIGHNGVNAALLRAFIERIEKLEEEKKALSEDIKEVYAEAKGTGFDVKIVRKIVALRKLDPDKRREEQEILDLYMSSLGMLADTPLGQSAVERAVRAFGEPVPLSEEEKAKGYSAAFINKQGNRVAIGAKVAP